MAKKVIKLTEADLVKLVKRVIAEQAAAPAQSNFDPKVKEFMLQLLGALQKGQTYIVSPLYPGRIVVPAQASTSNGVDGSVSYAEFLISDKYVYGNLADVPFYGQGKLASEQDIFAAADKLVPGKIKADPQNKTLAVNLAEVMFYAQGEKNPTAFLETIKGINPKAEEWLKAALVQSMRGTTIANSVDKNDARKVYQQLFAQGPTQPQPTKA